MNLDSQKENKAVTNSEEISSETKQQEKTVAKNFQNEATNIKKSFRNQQDRRNNKERSNKGRQDFRRPKEQSEFLEKVIWIRRINKVTTGGRRLRFSATVVVGNKKGTVGIGVAKANEVNDAIKKAIAAAHKNLKQVAINKDHSIYHHGMGNYCASKILLKPAKEGIGVKAGGSARDVIELAGIQNIYCKSLGSNNKINLARATIQGLSDLKSEDYFKNKIIKKRINPIASSEVKKVGGN